MNLLRKLMQASRSAASPAPRVWPVRRMERRDIDAVLKIEALVHRAPIGKRSLLAMAFGQRHSVPIVIERAGEVDGWACYALDGDPDRVAIERLAVHPFAQRRRLGTQLVERLKTKPLLHRRPILAADVDERDLGAQLFFRRLGFQAVGVAEGAIAFEWRRPLGFDLAPEA